MLSTVFSVRMRRAREALKFSLDDLSSHLLSKGLRISKQALSKYENGETKPDEKSLVVLAEVLEKPLKYFSDDGVLVLGDIDYRVVKSRFNAKDRNAIIARASDYFEKYIEVEDALGIDSEECSDLFDKYEVSCAEDAEYAANALREEWRLMDKPIPSVTKLLEREGIKLYRIDQYEGFDAFMARPDQQLLICFGEVWQPVRSDRLDLPRMRFNLIHELAHAVLKFSPELESSPKDLERMCHVFSGCFLIPSGKIRDRFEGERKSQINIRELVDIKEEYGISIKALAMRMVQCELLTQNAYRQFSIFYNMRGYGRTSDEPGRFIGNEIPSRFHSLIGKALLSESMTYAEVADLTGLGEKDVEEKYAILG